jgi:tetratricopeptide (TPR) repeat protein
MPPPYPRPEQDFPVLVPVLEDVGAGRLDAAEARALRLLASVRGTRSIFERDCCHALAVVYTRAGRHLEALLFAARSVALARAAGDVGRLAQSLSHLAVNLERQGLHARLAAALEDLDRVLDVEPDLLVSSAGAIAQHLRLKVAVHEGDERTARLVLRSVLASDHPPAAVKVAARALLAELAGEWEAALALWSTEEAAGGPYGPRHAQERRARALAKLGRLAEAETEATALLEALEGEPEDGARAQAVLDEAVQLGRFCGEVLQRPELARRCFDMAATNTMRRMVQLERLGVTLPELHALAADEVALLDDTRKAAREQQRAIASHVSESARLHGVPAALAGSAQLASGKPWTLCAWCDRLLVGADRWVPIGQFLAPRADVRVTHGICPPCQERVLASA